MKSTVYERKEGEVFSLPLAFTDSESPPNPIDLTGGTIYFTAKHHLDDVDADAVIDIKVTNHDDAAAGLSSIPIDLSAVSAARLVADIWFKDSAGNPTSYPSFDFHVVRGVTKSTAD